MNPSRSPAVWKTAQDWASRPRRVFYYGKTKETCTQSTTDGKRNIIRQILEEYDIETAEDIQDALKDLRGGIIKEMMEAEMDDHLGYEKSERSDNDDYRNGHKSGLVNAECRVWHSFCRHGRNRVP